MFEIISFFNNLIYKKETPISVKYVIIKQNPNGEMI